MTEQSAETLSVVVERDVPHAQEKVWRALTQPELLAQWLMKNDFVPVVDHRFKLTADWGAVECRVLEIDPITTLSYTWVAFGLECIVTWTLTPTSNGTHLRVEQSGFRADHMQAYHGAKAGWPRFLDALEGVVAQQTD